MLATQQQRELAVLQNFLCPGLDIGQCQLAGAKAQLQIAAVEHVKIEAHCIHLPHQPGVSGTYPYLWVTS